MKKSLSEREFRAMVTNRREVEKFERELLRNEKVDVKKSISIINAMYEEAVVLGVLPLKDPLEGLEVDIKIAQVVNNVYEVPGEDSERVR